VSLWFVIRGMDVLTKAKLPIISLRLIIDGATKSARGGAPPHTKSSMSLIYPKSG
jgi:hypothetical protein